MAMLSVALHSGNTTREVAHSISLIAVAGLAKQVIQ
jgi:hypothetical protein